MNLFYKLPFPVIILICFSPLLVYWGILLHDSSNELNKSDKQIIANMNCNNYKLWLDYRSGDILFNEQNIRDKAKQVGDGCK